MAKSGFFGHNTHYLGYIMSIKESEEKATLESAVGLIFINGHQTVVNLDGSSTVNISSH